MKNVKTKFSEYDGLTKENIAMAAAEVDTFLAENGADRLQRERYRLLLEDALLDYAQKDSGARFRVITHRFYKRLLIQLRVKCEQLNVIDEEQGAIREALLNGMTSKPEWRYRWGENILTYTEKTLVPNWDALKYVLRFMGEQKRNFRIGLVMRIINMILLVVEPLLAALIITAFNESDLNKIVLIAILVAVLEASSALFTYLAARNLTKAYRTLRANLQRDLSINMLKIKTEHMDEHSSGLFVERLTTETGSVVDGLDEMLGVVTELFRLVSLLVAFAIVSPTMLAFAIVLFVIYYFIVNSQARIVANGLRRLRVAKEKLNSFVVEMVKAHRDIKVHHCEESLLTKAEDSINDTTERTKELQNQSNRYIFIREEFVAWTNLAYLIALVLMMKNTGMTPATALILYNYNGKAYASARAVSGAASSIYALLLAAERIYQLMESPDFAHETFGEEQLAAPKGEIELRGVHYSYKQDGKLMPVLKGVNMHIRPGERVAFVGRSGCGKSTILSLLTRLYDPRQGTILLDGTEIQKLDQDSLRGNIGMVTQMPYLFNMSIRDNFTVIKKDVTDEEIFAACKAMCIHDDITQFAQGYDTVIGEGGVLLSGGQRQRIALARCLVGDYPIILLDEATSALDNETQTEIQRAIEGMEGKTVIMVAHRLSTVVNCQRLYFIADGKVAAAGTHEELLESCAEYRKLYGEEAAEEQAEKAKEQAEQQPEQ